MKATKIIPIFLPEAGCPQRCLFCSQPLISGQAGKPDPAAVGDTVRRWLEKSPGYEFDLAFYGGTFTALPPSVQEQYLELADSYRRQGMIVGIRLSTRPDCLTDQACELLQHYRVTIVELGVQSLSDQVLSACQRGYTARQAIDGFERLRRRGIKTGIQLMLGLPGDDGRPLADTIEEVCRLGPDYARLYPAIVLAGTGLAGLWRRGGYRPLTLRQAAGLAGISAAVLTGAGVKVMRIGLQAGPGLDDEGSRLAGPYHPALGELAAGDFARRVFVHSFSGHRDFWRASLGKVVEIVGRQQMRGKICGHRNENINFLSRHGFRPVYRHSDNPGVELCCRNRTIDWPYDQFVARCRMGLAGIFAEVMENDTEAEEFCI
ncbi:MAG: radical SAM protein [Negativicutes bacterium]|nr:radical SAM protein [Negativicutes bacterium]